MSDTTYLGRQMRSFTSAPQFDGYSRVVIVVSEDLQYTAGTKTGRTLTLNNPWGTQVMANNILKSIKGFQYQPYKATDSFLDPAAELGDGITANYVYSGIYTRKTRFGPSCTATVSAPEEEEVNHEYPYKPKQERVITRNNTILKAELRIQDGRITEEVAAREKMGETLQASIDLNAKEISAKVSKTGGDASSFGWTLTDSSWLLKSNGSTVFKATKSGVEVTGKITANSGKIGGYSIESDYLSYNGQTWGGTNSTGVYIGIRGIQLGKNFSVDNQGRLKAYSGEFTGSVRAGSIKYGNDNGYLSGSGLKIGSVTGGQNGQIGSRTLGTFNMGNGVNTSLGYADFSHDVFNGIDIASSIWASSLRVGYSGTQFTPRTISFIDGLGNTRTWTVLATG